jgi:hypothetical protein
MRKARDWKTMRQKADQIGDKRRHSFDFYRPYSSLSTNTAVLSRLKVAFIRCEFVTLFNIHQHNFTQAIHAPWKNKIVNNLLK